LIANDLVLHLSAFVRSLHLPLKLIIRTTRTANHVRYDGERGRTDIGALGAPRDRVVEHGHAALGGMEDAPCRNYVPLLHRTEACNGINRSEH
jgi:hypothetical protein